MRKLLFIFVLFMNFNLVSIAGTVQGGVEKEIVIGGNSVVDSATNLPVSGAKVFLPLDGYATKTDENGRFNLNTKVNGTTVLSVEKDGYKPFSITIDKFDSKTPLVLAIEKSSINDITLDTQMFHLGDNSFSENSANAHEFQVMSIGPYYSKSFNIPKSTSNASLVIGSIIGLDTKMAKSMGQNKIVRAYSSPVEVFFNNVKISELQINGDGQKIKLPANLIKRGLTNSITIKTGRNMMSESVDYDDIEIMNLSIETN